MVLCKYLVPRIIPSDLVRLCLRARCPAIDSMPSSVAEVEVEDHRMVRIFCKGASLCPIGWLLNSTWDEY
jgi:hypothetical protein